MMKLILPLALLWAFSSTAGALRCDICYGNDPLCRATGERLCPLYSKCMVAYIQVTSNGETKQQIFKNCVQDAMCPTTGPTTFSTSLNGLSTVVTAECCNTDNCNKGPLQFPALPTPSNLRCTTCDEYSGVCNSVQCLGVEDTCLKANVTKDGKTTEVLGCSTSSTCYVAVGVNHLPFLSNLGRLSGTPVCKPAPVPTTPPPTTTTTTTTEKPKKLFRSKYYSNNNCGCCNSCCNSCGNGCGNSYGNSYGYQSNYNDDYYYYHY